MRASLLFEIMTFSLMGTLAACGSGGDSGNAGGAGAGGLGGVAGDTGGVGGAGGNSSAPVSGANGLFEIHYLSATSIADIGGLMWDGPLAELVVWEKKKTDGDCSLYMPRAPFCESCPVGQVCVDTNVCRAQPASHSVGSVTMTGLKSAGGTGSGGASGGTSGSSGSAADSGSASGPLALTLVAENTTPSYVCAQTLTLPPCTVGSPVGLDATGAGEYPAFSVQAKCIAPLTIAKSAALLESGKPFTMTWTPGDVAEARITLEFDLSHHGGSKGQIRCDTADTGSLQVSAGLIKSLVDLGVTGFPWLTVARVAKGTTPVGSGQAQLKVYSDDKLVLEIPGLQSCNDSSTCPTGQTCQIPSYMCGTSCTTNTDCPAGQTCQASTKMCK